MITRKNISYALHKTQSQVEENAINIGLVSLIRKEPKSTLTKMRKYLNLCCCEGSSYNFNEVLDLYMISIERLPKAV